MKVVINADDLGYCPRRTAGIVELLELNKISSASLMVTVPTFSKEAAERVLKFKGRIGLHFNITEGAPITTATSFTKEGLFLGKGKFWETHESIDQ